MAKSLPAAITAGKGGDSERVIFAKIIPEPGDAWEDFFWATKSCNVIKKVDTGFVNHQGILFEDFETFGDWSKYAGDSIEDNTTEYREGAHSLKINSVNGASCSAEKTISKDLSGADNFVFWLYVHDNLTKNDYIAIYFSSVTDYSKYMVGTISGSQIKKGWNRLVICKSYFSATGGESWSNTMIRLRFRVCALAGENASFSFDDFRYNYRARAKCIIAFDDGTDSQYLKAKPIMDGNAQAGVAFVITDNVDVGGYMTKAQLETLRDAGWDISNHSKTHPDLRGCTPEELEDEVNGAYDWLVANGFSDSAMFFAYPYGYYTDYDNPDTVVIDKVKENHKTARATHLGDFQAHFTYDDDNIDFILKVKAVSNTTPVATIKGWIDRAEENNGLLILLFHKIVDADADLSTEYLTADFEEISDYLKTKEDAGDMQVITFSDCYREVYDGSVLAQSNFSPISQSVDIRQGGNVARVGGLSLKLVNPEFSGSSRFDEVFAGKNMENRTIEIRLGFYVGSDLDETDLLLLYRGMIEDVPFNYGTYQIKIRDAGFKRHKEIPDLILTEDNYDEIPEYNKGKIAPLLFGNLSGGWLYLSNNNAVPIIRINKNKEKYLIGRNKIDSFTPNVMLYFDDINRWAEIYPASGSFTLNRARPSTIDFPLGVDINARFYSQLEKQGAQTDPISLDFKNAVDTDGASYFTLGASEKLFLKVPMPYAFGAIMDEANNVTLRIEFGTVTGTGTIKYYNPEWDDGVGKFSTSGLAIGEGGKSYVFGNDKTAHGKHDLQEDQNDPWTFDEIATYEFGVEMDAESSAQIRNMYVYINGLLVRSIEGILVIINYSRHPIRRRGSMRKPPFDFLEKSDNLTLNAKGAEFGSWIDADSRNNGYDIYDLIEYGAYITEAILRDELGLTSSEIDYESFDAIGNTTNGKRKDWKFATRVDSQINSLEAIAGFCQQAGIIFFQDYQNKEKVVALTKQTAIKTIDRTTIQEDSIKINFSKLEDVFNEFYLNYDKLLVADNYRKTLYITASTNNLSSNTRSGTPNTYTGLCSNSQSKYNHTKRLTMDCDWINDDATAELFIKWLAEWHCYRKYIAPFETDGLDHIDLEIGDQVKIDHTLLPTGVSNDDSFLLFDISHNLDNDRMKFKFMQIPELLP